MNDYDWKKPWLIMNPKVAEKIKDKNFLEEIETFANVLVTYRMPHTDEVWLLPATEVQRLVNLTMNGLKHQISAFRIDVEN